MLELLPLDVAVTIAERLSSKERAKFAVLSKFCHLISVTGLRQICLTVQNQRQLESILSWLQSLQPHSLISLRNLQIQCYGTCPKFWPDTASLACFQTLTAIEFGPPQGLGNEQCMGTAALTRRTVKDLSSLPNLQKLVATFGTIEESVHIHTLSEFGALVRLTELRLWILNKTGQEKVELAPNLQGLRSLKTLEIRGAEVQLNDTLHALGGFLEVLVLKSTAVIESKDEVVVAHSLREIQIWSEDMEFNFLMYETSELLQSLHVHADTLPSLGYVLPDVPSSLTSLGLHEVFGGLRDIRKIETISSLLELDLSAVFTRDAVLQLCIHLTRLTKLTMESTSDISLPLLGPLDQLTSLRALNLTLGHDCDFGSIAHFLPNLRSLILSFQLGSNLQQASIERHIAGQTINHLQVKCTSSLVCFGGAHPAMILGDLPKLQSLTIDVLDYRGKDTMALCSSMAHLTCLTNLCFIHNKSDILKGLERDDWDAPKTKQHTESLECLLTTLRYLPAVDTLELVAPEESLIMERSHLQHVRRLGICCQSFGFERPNDRDLQWPENAVFILTGPHEYSGKVPEHSAWRRETAVFKDYPGHCLVAMEPDDFTNRTLPTSHRSPNTRYSAFYKKGPLGIEAWEPQAAQLKAMKRYAEHKCDR